MTTIFDPQALVGGEALTIVGTNDLTPEIAEDPDKFRAWQRKARTAGAEKRSHDTPEMRAGWAVECEYPAQAEARELLTRFEWPDKNPRAAMLYGRSGRGKSHLAGATTLRLRELGEPVVWISAALMLDQMRELVRDGSPASSIGRYREALERASWLVLDDLGAERPTDFAIEQLCMILDARYANRSTTKTLVTTNLASEQLYDRLGSRAASRLFGLCREGMVEVTGGDLRMEAA